MMEKPDQKVGKIFLVFAGISVIALPFIVLSAFYNTPKRIEAAVVETQTRNFDQNSRAMFEQHDWLSKDYQKGTSTGRTLSKYYSLRQYPGSPPYIPHPVEMHGVKLECLSCHANGGWTQRLKNMTPVTPHPEQISCRQCHVWPVTDDLFRENDWVSVAPPRLGRSYLPGAPLPIPHDLQMRGNCIACHIGPGTVATIRVEHPSRGNCRQCHVTDVPVEPFRR